MINKDLSITIILPFYNVEKYISQCLKSIYNQDIPEDKYEVICINDCSKDNSRDIVIEYQKNHSNLRLFEHKTNRMLGAARNTGLQSANGEYIWFIDSDDWIKPKCFSYLLSILSTEELDILNFNYYNQESKGNFSYERDLKNSDVIPGKLFCEQNHDKFWDYISAWRRIYNHSFLKSLNIKFAEVGYQEDTIFTLRSLYYSKRVKNLDERFYFYRYNNNSITRSKWTKYKTFGVCKVVTDLFEFSEEIKTDDSNIFRELNSLAIYWVMILSKKNLFLNSKERVHIISLIQKHNNQLLKSRCFKGWRYCLLLNPKFSKYVLFILSPLLTFAKTIKNQLNIKYKFIE